MTTKFLLYFILCLLLAACGSKGDLRLPEEKTKNNQKSEKYLSKPAKKPENLAKFYALTDLHPMEQLKL